jgi:hypothetical protein
MSIPYKRIVSKSAVSLIVDTALNDASYSTATDATAEIISLPSSTIERSELKMTVKGNTVVNILPDAVAGCESTDGWTTINASVATDNSNEYEGTNCLKATISSTVGTIRYDAISLLDKTKYYLISAYIKNGNATNVRLGFNTDDVDVDSSAVAATTYTRVGVVVQPTDFDTASFVFLQLRVDGANTQYGYIDAFMVNEISAAEYALGATSCMNKYAWHLGTADTESVEITSVGKNSLDAVNNTAFNSYATRQLEKSTSATTYEAYKSTTVQTPVTLRSVSSTIYDTFDVQTGVHMKNVAEYALTADDITEYVTSLSNIDYVKILKKTDAKNYNSTAISVYGTQTIVGYTENQTTNGTSLNDTAYINKFKLTGSKTEMYLAVTKGKYADTAAAKTALTGVITYYQLATPIQTNYPPQVLQAHVNGTVYIDDVDIEGTIPTVSYNYATTVKGQMDDNADMIERASQNNWGAWTPTVTWTTGTPEGSVAQTARYTVINNTCYFNYSYTATDGNDASALTITLPMTPKDNNAIIALQAQQKVNTTWTNPLAYIDDDSGGIAFRSLSACTNAQAVEVIVTGFYEV